MDYLRNSISVAYFFQIQGVPKNMDMFGKEKLGSETRPLRVLPPHICVIDDYAKDGGSGVLCSFYREPLCSLIVKEVQLLCHLISHWFQIED